MSTNNRPNAASRERAPMHPSAQRSGISRRAFGLGTLCTLSTVVGATLSPRLVAWAADGKTAITKLSEIKGSLFIIGGGAATTMRDFARLAGGSKAQIAILTHSSSNPAEAGDLAENKFRSFGVLKTKVINPDSKLGLPKDITAAWIVGGDQNRTMKLLDDDFQRQIRQFLLDGNLVGGSSAGAACVVPTMIAGNAEDGGYVLKRGQLQLVKGLGLFPGVVVDTHVKQKYRFERLMAAVSVLEDVVGIGLDEDTAIYVSNGKVKVYGAGHARIYKRGEDHKSDLLDEPENVNASVWNILVSCLAAGQEFKI